MGQPSQVKLFDYGIMLEDSDIRCHVAPGTRSAFVFQTASARSILPGHYRIQDAFQPGIAGRTAAGYLVPWRDIPDIRRIRWTSEPWWERFSENQTTSEKGASAVSVAQDLLRIGRMPLWTSVAGESQSSHLQIKGTDILLWGRWKIQVKCDWKAGDKGELGVGSGNLFLQIAERNPLGNH